MSHKVSTSILLALVARATPASPEGMFFYSILACMTLALSYWTVNYVGQVPYYDDWAYVPVLCDREPLTASWLWKDANNHRFPVSRLIMWACFHVTQGRYRLDLLFDVSLLSVSSILLGNASRRLRGRWAYTDAFFPLLLLHWANAENLLLYMSGYAFIGIACFAAVVSFLVSVNTSISRPLTGAACLGLVLLPLQGGQGAAQTPALVIAFLFAGVTLCRSSLSRELIAGRFVLFAALLAALGFVLYLFDYRGMPSGRSDAIEFNLMTTLSNSLLAASTSFGAIGSKAWPLSAPFMATLLVGTVCVIFADARRTPAGRQRAVLYLLGLSSSLCIAAAIAIGRTGHGGAGASRYMLLTAPIACCVYIMWSSYRNVAVSGFVQMLLFTIVCAFSTYHASLGIEVGKAHRRAVDALISDIDRGMPLTALAARHCTYFCWDGPPFRDGIAALKDRKVGVFARVKSDPPIHTVALGTSPSQYKNAVRTAKGWCGDKGGGTLKYQFGKRRFVYGVTMRFSMTGVPGVDKQVLPVHWTAVAQDQFDEAELREWQCDVWPNRPVRERTVWINAEISEFAIGVPPAPIQLHLESLSLLERPHGKSEERSQGSP